MPRIALPRLTLVAAAIAIAACSEPTTPTRSARTLDPSFNASGAGEAKTYVLLATSSTSLAKGLVAEVEKAGGTVTSALDGAGVIVATSPDADFPNKAGKISGISEVLLDQVVQWHDPLPLGSETVSADAPVDPQTHGPTGVGSHETFRLVQWAPDAVSAPAAWNAGYQGAGARVAILDGGVNRNHIDIRDNLDVARSRSFTRAACPAANPACNNFDQDLGSFWHGTHVAGIVAAPANNIGTVGIAPKATLIGVKVLHGGSGAFSWVINGIYYAATPIAEGGGGADIINMSLGATFPKQGSALAHLANAIDRATSYANKRGVTVIAAAGNNAMDFDHTANMRFVPAQSVGVVSVSALGPMGWAVPGTAFDLDRPASYTNYGQSGIEHGAPGGDFALPGTALCSKPRVVPAGAPPANVVTACWVFDMVMAPFGAANNTFGWAAGTSMASPAVAGVAALIIGKAKSAGQSLSPSQVRAKLEKSSDDLGKPGNDDYYGKGRVNAEKAVK